jgi:hypothetical protein
MHAVRIAEGQHVHGDGPPIDGGLAQDDSRPTGYDTVSLLDEETCPDLLADYSDHSTKLTWLNDTFTVTG